MNKTQRTNEQKESDLVYRMHTKAHGFWLIKRTLGYIYIYYINTNEIPRELSRENLISSHVKISPLLWLHNKLHLSDQKTISGRLEIRNFSSRVKKIFHLFPALTRDIFFNTRREISYPRAAM